MQQNSGKNYGRTNAPAAVTSNSAPVQAKQYGNQNQGGQAKVKPVFDLTSKDLMEDGKTDPNSPHVKITGLFENKTKSGEIYYSGSDKLTGKKYSIFPYKERDKNAGV